MTAHPCQTDDFPHRAFSWFFGCKKHYVRFRTFLQPFYECWAGMRQEPADFVRFYRTNIESYRPFQLRLESVPPWNNQVPISEQLASAINAKPIKHHTAKAFIRSITASGRA